MFIEPNTEIKILGGVGLLPNYEDTYYFSTKEEQANAFANYAIASFSKNTYQRHSLGAIKLEIEPEKMVKADYLMFKNSSYENKWFYAFITNFTWINNLTCAIYYEIDVIQSFMFDIRFTKCYIERMHTTTDDIGDNIEAEPLKLGEMFLEEKTLDSTTNSILHDKCFCLYANTDSNGVPLNGSSFPNNNPKIFSGATQVIQTYFSSGGFSSMMAIIDGYVTNGYKDSIIALSIEPLYPYENQLSRATFSLQKTASNSPFGNYTPKNKKLYTYPFNYVTVITPTSAISLAEEFFSSSSSCEFEAFFSALTPNSSIEVRPRNYRGQSRGTEAATLNSYPTVPYNTDSYKNWLAYAGFSPDARIAARELEFADNFTFIDIGETGRDLINAVNNKENDYTKLSASAQMLKSIAKGAAIGNFIAGPLPGAVGGGLWGEMSGSFNAVTRTMNEAQKAKLNSISTHGQMGNNAEFLNDLYKFRFFRIRVNEHDARRIDEFFNMYGYSVNRIDYPSINNRPYWTYIKTRGCNFIIKTVPTQYASYIRKIYDNGIRFWKHSNCLIGQYEQDNRV